MRLFLLMPSQLNFHPQSMDGVRSLVLPLQQHFHPSGIYSWSLVNFASLHNFLSATEVTVGEPCALYLHFDPQHMNRVGCCCSYQHSDRPLFLSLPCQVPNLDESILMLEAMKCGEQQNWLCMYVPVYVCVCTKTHVHIFYTYVNGNTHSVLLIDGTFWRLWLSSLCIRQAAPSPPGRQPLV